MRDRKHKRDKNHVVIVTSDAADASVKQFKIKPWMLHTIIIVLCIIVGLMLGYILYENKLWSYVREKNKEQGTQIETLKKEIEELQLVIEDLEDKNQILSDTVNQKVETENELTAVIESQSTPTGFPLNGSASLEETASDVPICLFTASEGTTVIATAAGVVSMVSDDATYGHVVKIDHKNGYVSIYLNSGDATVKEGDEVVAGTTLFIITKDNVKLGYQMMYEENYIDPMDMLAIEG